MLLVFFPVYLVGVLGQELLCILQVWSYSYWDIQNTAMQIYIYAFLSICLCVHMLRRKTKKQRAIKWVP